MQKDNPLFAEESAFMRQHKNDSDEELLCYVRKCAESLGKIPNAKDVIGYYFLKQKFGAWPRILEKAGLKEKSVRRTKKEEKMQIASQSRERYRQKRARKKLKKTAERIG